MAVYFIVPGRSNARRPQWPFALNPDSPQARGLVAWYPLLPLGIDMSAVSGRYGLSSVSGTPTTSASGTLNCAAVGFGSSALYTDTLPLTAVPLSLVAWAASTDPNNTQDVIYLGGHTLATASMDRWSLNFGGATAGDPIRAISVSGGTARTAVTGTGYTAGRWHHVAAVFTSSTLREAYIDGNATGTNTQTSVPGAPSRLSMGSGWASSALTADFVGTVAEARIYNRALTSAEILAQYDPATRWDLYWQPANRVFFNIAAAGRTTKNTRSHPLGVRVGHPWRVVA